MSTDRTPYGAWLARVHHERFGNVAAAAAECLVAELVRRRITGGTVVDLAAGTGILSRRLADAGYDVVGCDISPDMLALARQSVPSAEFVESSLWDFELPTCVAVAAIGEAFNYSGAGGRPSIELLQNRFEHVRSRLVDDGCFVFDLAGPGRSGPNGRRERSWTFDDVTMDLVEIERDGLIERTIDLGAASERRREVHTLVPFSPESVMLALRSSGLRGREIPGYGEFGLRPGWQAFLATTRS